MTIFKKKRLKNTVLISGWISFLPAPLCLAALVAISGYHLKCHGCHYSLDFLELVLAPPAQQLEKFRITWGQRTVPNMYKQEQNKHNNKTTWSMSFAEGSSR